jgi:hypothetical protein
MGIKLFERVIVEIKLVEKVLYNLPGFISIKLEGFVATPALLIKTLIFIVLESVLIF